MCVTGYRRWLKVCKGELSYFKPEDKVVRLSSCRHCAKVLQCWFTDVAECIEHCAVEPWGYGCESSGPQLFPSDADWKLEGFQVSLLSALNLTLRVNCFLPYSFRCIGNPRLTPREERDEWIKVGTVTLYTALCTCESTVLGIYCITARY